MEDRGEETAVRKKKQECQVVKDEVLGVTSARVAARLSCEPLIYRAGRKNTALHPPRRHGRRLRGGPVPISPRPHRHSLSIILLILLSLSLSFPLPFSVTFSTNQLSISELLLSS